MAQVRKASLMGTGFWASAPEGVLGDVRAIAAARHFTMHPQRLKPPKRSRTDGTAEAVPLSGTSTQAKHGRQEKHVHGNLMSQLGAVRRTSCPHGTRSQRLHVRFSFSSRGAVGHHAG